VQALSGQRGNLPPHGARGRVVQAAVLSSGRLSAAHLAPAGPVGL